MPDISAFVDPIAEAIYQQYEKRAQNETARTYLGASIIGRECKRALWYAFRWAAKEKFEGRMLRLFETGHREEARMVDNLRSIGATVYDVDPSTGQQFGFADHGGHMRGHMDGCAQGLPTGGQQWHVLEFKTHNSKSFAGLKKQGVAKAKPEHYAQMMWYMGQSGMTRALYLAVNKDTDDLYAERIEFDPVAFGAIQAKAESIIFAAEPPAKLSEDPKFYLCNFCAYKGVCHGGQTPPPSCRTCVHATPERDGDGRWSCAKHSTAEIPIHIQRKGCENHLPLPFLLTYATAIDAGDGWIMFKRKDQHEQPFIVSDMCSTLPGDLPLQHNIYSTHEISAAQDHRLIAHPVVDRLKSQYGAKIVE